MSGAFFVGGPRDGQTVPDALRQFGAEFGTGPLRTMRMIETVPHVQAWSSGTGMMPNEVTHEYRTMTYLTRFDDQMMAYVHSSILAKDAMAECQRAFDVYLGGGH